MQALTDAPDCQRLCRSLGTGVEIGSVEIKFASFRQHGRASTRRIRCERGLNEAYDISN